jgi:hypothetical protein
MRRVTNVPALQGTRKAHRWVGCFYEVSALSFSMSNGLFSIDSLGGDDNRGFAMVFGYGNPCWKSRGSGLRTLYLENV